MTLRRSWGISWKAAVTDPDGDDSALLVRFVVVVGFCSPLLRLEESASLFFSGSLLLSGSMTPFSGEPGCRWARFPVAPVPGCSGSR